MHELLSSKPFCVFSDSVKKWKRAFHHIPISKSMVQNFAVSFCIYICSMIFSPEHVYIFSFSPFTNPFLLLIGLWPPRKEWALSFGRGWPFSLSHLQEDGTSSSSQLYAKQFKNSLFSFLWSQETNNYFTFPELPEWFTIAQDNQKAMKV